MGVWDSFSKREQRKANAGKEEVYQYDTLPPAFRTQVTYILLDAIGKWVGIGRGPEPSRHHLPDQWWQFIFDTVRREKGQGSLTANHYDCAVAQCCEYIARASTADVLDIIELAFRVVDRWVREINQYQRENCQLSQEPDDAISELNQRFREHRIGYQYESGELIRMDSTYIHTEAVKPALELLTQAGKNFAGPLQEFLEAHAKYRKGEHKQAILTASHAFESTLKAICTERGWTFDAQRDTAGDLIKIIYANNLIPPHLQNHFNGLRTLLESGPHVTRNKTPGAGHGQGPAPMEPPIHVVRYALNLAASNIVFLIESHQALP